MESEVQDPPIPKGYIVVEDSGTPPIPKGYTVVEDSGTPPIPKGYTVVDNNNHDIPTVTLDLTKEDKQNLPSYQWGEQSQTTTGLPQKSKYEENTVNALTQSTLNAFKNPIFEKVKNRDTYFDTLSTKYPKNIIDQVRTSAEFPYTGMSKVINVALAPAQQVEHIPESLSKVGQGFSNIASHSAIVAGDSESASQRIKGIGKGVLKVAAGTGTAAIEAANVIPGVAAISMGLQAGKEAGLPVDWIMPFSKGVEEYYKSKDKEAPEWGKDAANVADILLGMGVIKGVDFAMDKATPLSTKQVATAIDEAFASPKDLEMAVESHGDPHAISLMKQRDELKQAIDNPKIDPQIKEQFIQPKVDEVNKALDNLPVLQADVNTKVADLKAQRGHLESQVEQLPDAVKEPVVKAIDEVNNQLNELDPKPRTSRDELLEIHTNLTKDINEHFGVGELKSIRDTMSAASMEKMLRTLEDKGVIKIKC